MKTKTVFSEFQLYADEEARFFEYCLENGQYFVRPLAPFLKNEYFEIYRKENMKHAFFAVVQIRLSGRKLIPWLIDVLDVHRQYQLLGDVLAYSEKVNMHVKGCVHCVYGWRVFARDCFGNLKDITKTLALPRKIFIENIARYEDVFQIELRSCENKHSVVYFEQINSSFQPIGKQWLADTAESFRRQKEKQLCNSWQKIDDELF